MYQLTADVNGDAESWLYNSSGSGSVVFRSKEISHIHNTYRLVIGKYVRDASEVLGVLVKHY